MRMKSWDNLPLFILFYNFKWISIYFHLVLGSFVVFVSRHAAVSDGTTSCLFDLSLPTENFTHLVTRHSRIRRLPVGNTCEIRYTCYDVIDFHLKKCPWKCILSMQISFFRGDMTAFTKIYFPTHLRFTPWLIGILAGYLFFKTRNTTVRIPRVRHQNFLFLKNLIFSTNLFILFLFLTPLTGFQFVCMGFVISHNGHSNIFKLSTCSNWFQSDTDPLWTLRYIQ